MKKSFFLISLLLASLFSGTIAFAIEPTGTVTVMDRGSNGIPKAALERFLSLSPKELEKMTGHHMNFKERVAFKLLKWKMKWQNRMAPDVADSKYDRMGKWSLVSGIAAFAFCFIPGVAIISIPAALLAIVLGALSVKKARKKAYSVWGIVLGISFLVFLTILIIAYLSFFSFNWV